MCNRYHVPGDEYEPQFVGERPFGGPKKIGPYQEGMFFRPADNGLKRVLGQWGMIRPGAPSRWEFTTRKDPATGLEVPTKERRMTNNCRSETMHRLPTFRDAWTNSRRCVIPALTYDEPNWETKKCIYWSLARADGAPWLLAGLWSEWADLETGELVPNYTMVTVNCDDHPLLSRLHKPDPKLPATNQDKRAVVPLMGEAVDAWLYGTHEEARAALVPPPAEVYDQGAARFIDELLAQAALGPAQGSLL